MSKICPNCNAVLSDDAGYCNSCGAQLNDAYVQQNDYNQNMQTTVNNEMPMKWFKFVIYFQLFAGAFIGAVNAARYLTGLIYGIDAESVYLVFPALGTADKVYGVILLLLAAMAIFVRMQLAKYKLNASTFYIAYLGIGLVANLIYSVYVYLLMYRIMGAAVEEYSSVASIIGYLLGNGIVLVLNIVYFKKRKHLFVN